MSNERIKTALVGCGNVAKPYADDLQVSEYIELVGFTDIDTKRAEEFAQTYGGKAYATLEDLLADDDIPLIINLTIHFVHYEVILKCLQAGKHVHTEKPFAFTYKEAKELVDLAEAKGLRLSSAPTSYMGDAQTTAWKAVNEKKAGEIKLVYAEVNHDRIESWHPNPIPFYKVGPLWDVGIYAITLMTAVCGPVKSVTGQSRIVAPKRTTFEGKDFELSTPDFYVALLDFANGVTGRLTANFYAAGCKQGGSLEFIGDKGYVYLGNFQDFSAPVEYGEYRKEWIPLPHVDPPLKINRYARGVEELGRALSRGEPHRAQGAHAAHVVEIIEAILKTTETGGTLELTSSFTQPTPLLD